MRHLQLSAELLFIQLGYLVQLVLTGNSCYHHGGKGTTGSPVKESQYAPPLLANAVDLPKIAAKRRFSCSAAHRPKGSGTYRLSEKGGLSSLMSRCVKVGDILHSMLPSLWLVRPPVRQRLAAWRYRAG